MRNEDTTDSRQCQPIIAFTTFSRQPTLEAMETKQKKAFSQRLIQAMLESEEARKPGTKHGVDSAALQDVTKVSREMARRYLEGMAIPNPDPMKKIADWLHVRVTWLRDGEEPMRTTGHNQLNEEVAQYILNLGKRVKELRTSKGWSQAELAKKAGVQRPSVTQWESGNTKNIRNDHLVTLAKVFGITTDELLTGIRRVGKESIIVIEDDAQRDLNIAFHRMSDEDRRYVVELVKRLSGTQQEDITINAEELQGKSNELKKQKSKKTKVQ